MGTDATIAITLEIVSLTGVRTTTTHIDGEITGTITDTITTIIITEIQDFTTDIITTTRRITGTGITHPTITETSGITTITTKEEQTHTEAIPNHKEEELTAEEITRTLQQHLRKEELIRQKEIKRTIIAIERSIQAEGLTHQGKPTRQTQQTAKAEERITQTEHRLIIIPILEITELILQKEELTLPEALLEHQEAVVRVRQNDMAEGKMMVLYLNIIL